MNAYHRTWAVYAKEIIQNGFRKSGPPVQLSDRPLDVSEIKAGTGGDMVLRTDCPEAFLALHEHKGTHYSRHNVRVFQIPAEAINPFQITLHESDYTGVTKSMLQKMIEGAHGMKQRPGSPSDHATVLAKALEFLEEQQRDESQRRHRLVELGAYYGWLEATGGIPLGTTESYWLQAEARVDEIIKRLGEVPFF